MVGACKVKPESCSYIVNDKNYSLFGAELSDLLPIALCGENIINEIARGDRELR